MGNRAPPLQTKKSHDRRGPRVRIPTGPFKLYYQKYRNSHSFITNEKDAAPQNDLLLGQALHDHSVMVHRQQISDISREMDDMAQESKKGVASYEMPRQTACWY